VSGIDLLCEIIAQGEKPGAASFNNRPEYSLLLRGGYIRDGGVVQSVVCQDCDDPHDAEVLFEDGKYGYVCPAHGFVSLDRGSVSNIKPDVAKIVSGLADAFGCKRRKTSPVSGTTWRIGVVESLGGDIGLYLHPRLISS